MADRLESVSVPRPQPGWVTIVVSDHETGALGQVPVNLDILPAAVRAAIEGGLDTAIRARAAELEGGTWLDYTTERAREVIARG